jgi:hypothetical protein
MGVDSSFFSEIQEDGTEEHWKLTCWRMPSFAPFDDWCHLPYCPILHSPSHLSCCEPEQDYFHLNVWCIDKKSYTSLLSSSTACSRSTRRSKASLPGFQLLQLQTTVLVPSSHNCSWFWAVEILLWSWCIFGLLESHSSVTRNSLLGTPHCKLCRQHCWADYRLQHCFWCCWNSMSWEGKSQRDKSSKVDKFLAPHWKEEEDRELRQSEKTFSLQCCCC